METILELRLPDYRCSNSHEKSEEKEPATRERTKKIKALAKQYVFQMFCGSGRLKSMLAKAVGAELFGRMRENITLRCRRRSTCQSQKTRKTQPPSAFGR